MQYFPSDEFIKSIVATGATTLELPSGSSLRVGGQFYDITNLLGMDMNVSGLGGLDTGVISANTEYFIYVIEDAESLYLMASLDANMPTGYTAYRRIGKIETDGASEVSVINADLINEVQQSQIETIQLSVSQNASDISTLQTTSGGSATDIANLQTDVGTLQADVSTLQTDMGTAQTDITNLQSQQSTNTTNIGTNTTDIGTNTSAIGTNLSSITAISSQQTINSANISTLQGNIVTHDGRLDSLETAFDPSLGHTHDGIDAPQVLATELSSTGSTGAGQFLSSDGSGGTTWGDLPDGTLQDLSNLTATSINQSLIPNITEARDLGSSSLMWQFVYATNLELKQGINASGAIQLKDGFTSNYGLRIQGSSGLSYKGEQINGYVRGNTAGQAIALYTVDGSNSGDIRVRSGDASGFGSGDVRLRSGDAPAGGQVGNISLTTGTLGGAGTDGQISLTAVADNVVLGSAPTGVVPLAVATTGYVDSAITASAITVNDSITDGNTTSVPSENAVFDALALKIDTSALSNVTNDAQLPLSYLDTAIDLGGVTPSDLKVSSQLAIKTYVDSAISGSGGASTDLSNLTATSINQSLTPNTDGTRQLGTNLLRWGPMYGTAADFEGTVVLKDQFTTLSGLELRGNSGTTVHGYSSIYGQVKTLSSRGLGVYTESGAPTTGQLFMKTGDSSGGNSGNISIEVGTASATRGTITLKAGADDTRLEVAPTGAQSLAVATTGYVDSAVSIDLQAESANFTAVGGKTHITTGVITAQLPAPAANLAIRIKKTDNNTVTVARNGTETIDGVAADYSMTTDKESIFIVSDGTNWFLL
jgi:hypothetical protein